MTKKNCIKPAVAVVGAALVGSLSAINVASANENPFGATQLESGYMMLASSEEAAEKEGAAEGKAEEEGKCGEGKCGDGKKKEGKCGEGKCGDGKKTEEGKCGEGKCGGK
jgi:uncharacterized low-complexity protein